MHPTVPHHTEPPVLLRAASLQQIYPLGRPETAQKLHTYCVQLNNTQHVSLKIKKRARIASFDLSVFLKRDCIFTPQFLAVKMKSQHLLIKIKKKNKKREKRRQKTLGTTHSMTDRAANVLKQWPERQELIC